MDEAEPLLLPVVALAEMTQSLIGAYAQASGDANPIHADREAARRIGFPDVPAHGMLVMGMAGRAFAEWFPGRTLRLWQASFVEPVLPGERLHVRGCCGAESLQPGNEIRGRMTVVNDSGRTKLSGLFVLI